MSPSMPILEYIVKEELMKSPKEDYEIRKSVVSDLRSREDQLNYLSFYTLVIYHVIISRSNKCTSKEFPIIQEMFKLY